LRAVWEEEKLQTLTSTRPADLAAAMTSASVICAWPLG